MTSDGRHHERAHAPWSPSASDRNWNCAGSLAYCDGLYSPNSEAAARGTVCHEFGEWFLRNGGEMSLWHHLGDVRESGGFSITVTAEMIDAVNAYIRAVRSFLGEGDELILESQVDLEKLGFPIACTGTADVRIYSPATRTLHVIDAKFGKKAVQAIGNRQLRTYGAGALLDLPPSKPVERLVVTIVQPTTKRVTTSEVLTIAEMVFWLLDLKRAMEASCEAREAKPHMEWFAWAHKYLTAGSHCWFCPRSMECPVKAHAAAKVDQYFVAV